MSLMFYLFSLFTSIIIHALEIPIIDSTQRLGFVGNYAGVSNIDSQQQFESLARLSSALVKQQGKAGSFDKMGTFEGGNITCSCSFQNGDIYFGGFFTTVNQQQTVNHIVKFSTQNNQFQALGQGLDGPVYTVYCDQVEQILYVGGNFSVFNNSDTFGNAVQWNLSNNNWASLPWKGFNGPVYTITRNIKQNTLLFGGRFDATGNNQFFNSNTSQVVAMSSPLATISSGNGAFNSNASSIVCPSKPSPTDNDEQTWYLQEGVPGYWDANFNNPIQPTVFRLSNTHADRGTLSFYILALGSNEVYQLSYTDPVTQATMFCASDCLLSNDTYQDFTVINSISTSGIRIYIKSWYGSGGGLGYVQIFESDVSINPSLNNASLCSTSSVSPSFTKTIVNGDWKEVYVYGYYRNVLEATVPYASLAASNLSIVYQPNIPAQGLYEVYATTPGCVGSSNCYERTQVDYQLELQPNVVTTIRVNQKVYSDTRILIYSGIISPVSASFRPSLTLVPTSNVSAPSQGDSVSIMADTLEFIRNSSGVLLVSILEYNLTSLNTSSSWRPLNQQLPTGATVYSLDASAGDVLYIGGSFLSVSVNNSGYQNVVSYDYLSGKLVPISNQVSSGVNGKVSKLILHNSDLYVAGEFNSTVSLSPLSAGNIAKFDTLLKDWSSLERGVDGPVNHLFISPDNSTLSVSGFFQHYINQNNQKISLGNAQWNIEQMAWIEPSSLIVGEVVADVSIRNQDRWIAGGILGAQTYRTDLVTSTNINASRNIFSENIVTTAGVVWPKDDSSSTIIAYHTYSLKTEENNDTTTFIVCINSEGTWTNISYVQGKVNTLTVFQDKLYMGGQFSADPQRNISASFAIYDLANNSASLKVAGILDEANQPGIVHTIKIHPDGERVLVGGQFSKAGALDCSSVCVVGLSNRQWNDIYSGLSGIVYDIITTQSNQKVFAIGNLTVQGKSTQPIASVSDQSNIWTIEPSTSQLQSTANSAILQSNNQFIISGTNSTSSYIGRLIGDMFEPLNFNLDIKSQINQLLSVPISSFSLQKRFPDGTQNMLLAVGQLYLTDFGNASAALFDGNTWYPYLLTTQIVGYPGIINQIIHSVEPNLQPQSSSPRHLSIAAVILISMGISTGVLFSLTALGVLFLLKNHTSTVGPEEMPPWRPSPDFMDTLGLLGAGPSNTAAAGPSNAAT